MATHRAIWQMRSSKCRVIREQDIAFMQIALYRGEGGLARVRGGPLEGED